MTKRKVAIILNAALALVAYLTVPTSFSFNWHRPEVPQELLEK